MLQGFHIRQAMQYILYSDPLVLLCVNLTLVHTDYDSKSKTKRRKLSPRPRSVSPMPTPRPATSGTHRRGKLTGTGKRTRPVVKETKEKEGEGIVDIFKTIDISSLMGSIQQVKKQTEGEKSTSPSPLKKVTFEDNSTELKVTTLQAGFIIVPQYTLLSGSSPCLLGNLVM